jgi:hypothetical protein
MLALQTTGDFLGMQSKSPLIAAIAVAVVLIAAAWSFYTVFVKAPIDLAQAAARGIKEVFSVTPQVKIHQTVVIEQNVPIMEFAMVARDLKVDYSWSHTWLGSTKTIGMSGVFTAKAGFDLKEPFTLTITRSPLRVAATLPPPKLLSLDMGAFQITRDDDGWWNKVSAADRETVVRELQATARAQAESSGILEEARASAQQRIREIVERNGAVVEFVPPAGM